MKLALSLAAVLAALLAWELGVEAAEMPEYLLPAPSVILKKFWQTLPVQMEHLAVTAGTTLAGLVMALGAGVVLALVVMTYVKPLQSVILPLFAAFNGIPKIAIAPLLVTWLGLGAEPKVLLAFLLALFPVFVNAATGLSEIQPDVLDLARLFGGTELRIFWKVRLMNALPYLSDAVQSRVPARARGLDRRRVHRRQSRCGLSDIERAVQLGHAARLREPLVDHDLHVRGDECRDTFREAFPRVAAVAATLGASGAPETFAAIRSSRPARFMWRVVYFR